MEIVCIHSYKGGAGKTTIALNLATQLTSIHGKKVLLIESDFKMPSFEGIFDFKPPHYYNEYFVTEKNLSLQDCIRKHPSIKNLDLIFANPTFNPEEKIHLWDKRYHAFHLRRLQSSLLELKNKNIYDYVIFDTPPGLSYIAINNIALSNYGIVVVRPNSQAIKGTFNMLEQLYLKTKSTDQINLFIVFNQIPRVPMTKELNDWAQKFISLRIKEAGRIPCSCQGTYDMAIGKHIFESDHEINSYMKPLVSYLKKEDMLVTIPDPTTNF